MTTLNDDLRTLLEPLPGPTREIIRRTIDHFITQRQLNTALAKELKPINTKLTNLEIAIAELRDRVANVEARLAKLAGTLIN
jgi:hypothetical protein